MRHFCASGRRIGLAHSRNDTEPTSGLENHLSLLQLRVSHAYWTSNLLYVISVLGLSILTATNVKVGTICVDVLSNSRAVEKPTSPTEGANRTTVREMMGRLRRFPADQHPGRRHTRAHACYGGGHRGRTSSIRSPRASPGGDVRTGADADDHRSVPGVGRA